MNKKIILYLGIPIILLILIKSLINPLNKNEELVLVLLDDKGDNVDKVKQLLNSGANPNFRGGYGNTPLIYARNTPETTRSKIVKLLLDKGADVNLKSDDGDAPLLGFYQFEIVKMLLRAGADVNVKEKTTGMSPLHLALWYGRNDTAALLCENGCNVNDEDILGRFPLYFAACFGNTESIKLLIRYGADPLKKNKQGKTIYELLAEHQKNVERELYNGEKAPKEKIAYQVIIENIKKNTVFLKNYFPSNTQKRGPGV